MPPRQLRAARYLTAPNNALAKFIVEELPYLDYEQTIRWYDTIVPILDDDGRRLLGCNDRYFLLTALLRRKDALHEWLFDRCREVEEDPDGHIDLWARFHYKSTIITFAGSIQEILCDPDITISIFSFKQEVAAAFLLQIKRELEDNEYLKTLYSDVLYAEPRKESPKWSENEGLIVKRRSNPKEATLESHGLVDGQPVSRHYHLHIYDDVVTLESVTNATQIRKTTIAWEMADNLGGHEGVRKWMPGTRYNFGDTYGIIIERRAMKPRIYAATHDGTLKGDPVFLTPKRWAEIKNTQRSTVSAQMLQNPIAGVEATFRTTWINTYDIYPAVMNVYLMCDPSKGSTDRSDRTAIAVVGVDPANNRYLLDGVRHRMRLSDRWRFIKQLRKKWLEHPGVQIVRAGYERYGMQTDLEVIEEWQQRDDVIFEIEELNTPRQGKHSKNDRIERLEPDMRGGKWFLPAVVHHPDLGGPDSAALFSIWSEDDQKKAEAAGEKAHTVGHIIYRPMMGPTRLQRYMQATAQNHRIVTAIKRRDENGDVYDLTRGFMEEVMFHPFAPHDDMLDATSRLYDMEPLPAIQFEDVSTEIRSHPDS